MKIGLYSLDSDKEKLEDLLTANGIVVKKLLVGGVSNTTLIAVYEGLSETLGREGEQLERVKAIAHELRTDDKYRELKNANQRVLYLLDRHNVPKAVATDVIDYLKVMDVLD